MSFLQLNFVQGDVKPVVFTGVVASTGSAIGSAAYTQTNHVTGATIASAVSATVSGATITTPNITWSTAGQFLVLLAVTFADGTLDHSIGAYVNVASVPT